MEYLWSSKFILIIDKITVILEQVYCDMMQITMHDM